ncbi:hypothetical protein XELAEV_18004038mg [Xenopus laevis]|uniref:Uncharacterized protein n=1 Tax=Xenopus laevis TaxID=8355 RepID=A0A974BQ27_XENLA|nr:hypothetical protein XELAEV_18004038mg [Xenopus laevis]
MEKYDLFTQSWLTKDLSWIGRMATVKTILLPKLLYLFRTIPKNKFFFLLLKVILTFVWKHFKPRIATNILTKSKSQGL